jgi:predicted deacylase
MSVIKIDPYIKCAPGKKLYTYFNPTLPASVSMPDGSTEKIPLIVVNGKEKGPVAGFFAALHGDELEGVRAIQKIAEKLNPNEMRGGFIGVPVVNPAGYNARTRNNPVDDVNMNRIFPGKREGTISERIAYYIYQYIIPQLSFILSFHSLGSRAWAINQIQIRHYLDSNLWNRTKEIASICGLKYISVISGTPNGQMDDFNARDSSKEILYISTEMSGVGIGYTDFDEKVEKCVKAESNILKFLNIIDGTPDIPEPPKFIGKERPPNPVLDPSLCKVGGFMVPKVKPGDDVKEGDKLADILDMFGNSVESTYAPYDGIVRRISSYPVVPANSTPVDIWKFLSDEDLE